VLKRFGRVLSPARDHTGHRFCHAGGCHPEITRPSR
jgi:hypothetical protein